MENTTQSQFKHLSIHMERNVRAALQIASGKSWHIVWIIFILLYNRTFLTTSGLGFERSDKLYDYLIQIVCFGTIIGSSKFLQ